MRKKSFIFALHGLVFSLYLILDALIDEQVYGFLERVFDMPWLVSVCDLVISAFLYVTIYNVVYLVRKWYVVYAKKEVVFLGGTWYHLHIKHDENGNPKPDGLRPGITEVKQDLYELRFTAKNHNCILNDDGTITWKEDERKDTIWHSWSVDWDGKNKLVTCFKASTQVKNNEEFTERHGIHKLEVLNGGKKMKGNFADEYPSKSKGEIYFFRTEKELYDFMKSQQENE